MTEQKIPGQLWDANAALEFMLGGNARFTLRSKKTQTRYTYRVRAPKYDLSGSKYFVSYLTGSDNENDYAYIGKIEHNKFRLTKASKLLLDSAPIKAITWTLEQLAKRTMPDQLEMWHEGHCGRCGRTLTVPESIASGFGPECMKRREGKHAA